MKMVRQTILVFMVIFIFISCDKNREYMGEGVITGADPRDCACCGGILINLNSSSTELFMDSTYQVDLVPEDFDITPDINNPVYILLDYERNGKLCGKTIDILRFERK